MYKKNNILLVEDDVSIAMAEKAFLEKHGYLVRICTNGEECLDVAGKESETIALIIMDIHLGHGPDGIETAGRLLSFLDIPLIFLSDFTDEDTLKRVQTINHSGYVTKNSGNFILLETIRKAIKKHNLHKPGNKILRAFQESEERFGILIENLPMGVYLHNLDGEIQMVNKMAGIATGYTQDELLGMNVIRIDPKAVSREDRTEIWIKLQHQNYHRFESVHRRKNGTTYPVEVTVSAITLQGNRMLLGIAQDVTERLKALEELEFFKFAVDCSSNAMGISTPEGRHWYQNAAFTHLFGEKVNIGEDPPARIYANEEKARGIFRQVKLGENFSGEVEMYSKAGDIRQIYLKAYATRNAAGKIVGLIGVHMDITERKNLEASIRKLLVEKKLLLKEVHHRIKNDMITIQSLLSLQAMSAGTPEAANALLEAKERIRLMRTIYKTLYQEENFKFINIRFFINELMTSIKQTYTIAREIEYDLNIEEIHIPAKQALHIGIIINELVTNAFKYAFGEKKALLQVSLVEKPAGILNITVTDNGRGLPPEINQKKEYGFGLTLVTSLLKHHAGEMQIETGGGTSFLLTIPLDTPPEATVHHLN